MIDILRIQQQCAGRRCSAHFHHEPVHLVLATEVSTGFRIRIDIESTNAQLPIDPNEATSYFDVIDFMQRPVITTQQEQADPSPRPASEPACPTFQFNPDAPVFTPGLHDMTEFVQEMHEIWIRAAVAWEHESPWTTFITWFVDHRTWYPRCIASRPLTVLNNFAESEDEIRATWNDQLDMQVPHEYYVVVPPNLERGVAGHIILVQAPRDDWVSNLVTVFDSFIGRRSNNMMRLVVTTHEHIHIEQIVNSCGYDLVHGQLNLEIPCRVWIDGNEIHAGRPWPGRSGHAITLQVQRLVIPMPATQAPEIEPDVVAMLQSHLITTTTTLSLNDLIPASSSLVPFCLTNLDYHSDIPTTLFLEDGASESDIEHELSKFGHQRHVYMTGLPGKFITVPIAWKAVAHHYIYCPSMDTSPQDLILHSELTQMDELRHMRFLHECGFLRAVVTGTRTIREGLHMIAFHNNLPELEVRSNPIKTPTPWPAPQPVHKFGVMVDIQRIPNNRPDACLSLGVEWDDIVSFFQSSTDVLCPWVFHLDAPDFVKEGLHQIIGHDGQSHDPTTFDRLIIYTDGLSKSSNRRKPPMLVAERDHPDAWAFVVLGETYPTKDQQGKITFIGWHAQQIMYESDNNAYTGTDQIGAEFAERET